MIDGYHVVVEADHSLDEPVAGEIARALCEAYPGHPWHVAITGGLIVIKHLRMTAKWGMIRKYDAVHDANRLRREVVSAAGELLERAHMLRGRATEDRVSLVEGIPKKDLVIG